MDDSISYTLFWAYAPVLVILLVYLIGGGLVLSLRWKAVRRQFSYMDRQTEIGSTAVEQNKAFSDIVANQYRESNERTERALAQAQEALKVNTAALEQLTQMNATLKHLAGQLEDKSKPA